jgi:hypothetical protein
LFNVRHRYNIIEVSFTELSGEMGVALACAENCDACMLDSDMKTHAFGGRMWYCNSEESTPMPAVAQVVTSDAILLEQLQQAQKCRFVFVCQGFGRSQMFSVEFYYSGPQSPSLIHPRSHVYPAPRYLKLCYLAHRKAGELLITLYLRIFFLFMLHYSSAFRHHAQVFWKTSWKQHC